MNKRQHKGLSQASRRPNHLAEKVDLPERIDMEFEEFIPSTTASLVAGPNPFLLEDVCDSQLTDRANPKFFNSPKIRP